LFGNGGDSSSSEGRGSEPERLIVRFVRLEQSALAAMHHTA